MDRMVESQIDGQGPGQDERIRVRASVAGVVQGVGFRPFVYRLALRERLDGFILNNPQGVTIEVEGGRDAIGRFLSSLVGEPPPLARIDRVSAGFLDALNVGGFEIRESDSCDERTTLLSPDIATCPDCLREVADPADRRHGYPFINCTNCGPRYTIIEDIPYDRRNTSMARFAMCPACEREYSDPADRRFHAEPNACPVCGPRVTLRDPFGSSVACDDPIAAAAASLRAGKIVAIKGLGGFHLAADATDEAAVELLRLRKQREEKPLAVMARDIASVRLFADTSVEDERLLLGPQRPIVLLKKRPVSPIASAVAPGNRYLGVMLPYTPLHHLLLDQGFVALVMTSGNLKEEPIAVDMADASRRLGKIADLVVDHDREIVVRCDDSVVRPAGRDSVFLRRSRGWAPLPIEIDSSPPSILACGAHLKNTVAVSRRNQVFVSQHIGDLENAAAYHFFVSSIEHLKQITEVEPSIVAYDLHPDYLSTRFALASAIRRKIGVQHHHAHVASCLGEAGIRGPVIGFALDGTGYGPDGTVWGGEILLATRGNYSRAGHLEQVAIPGGDAAIKHVWRMALAHLYNAYGEETERLPLAALVGADREQLKIVLRMLERGVNSPLTSSCGRLFDAVSCMAGVRREVSYEGQAALELEMISSGEPDGSYPVTVREAGGEVVIGVTGMIKAVSEEAAAGIDRGEIDRAGIGARFHEWLARSMLEVALILRARSGVSIAALSGGCFQNSILLSRLRELLSGEGFEVLINRSVPANDGGISFGQAVVAAELAREDTVGGKAARGA